MIRLGCRSFRFLFAVLIGWSAWAGPAAAEASVDRLMDVAGLRRAAATWPSVR